MTGLSDRDIRDIEWDVQRVIVKMTRHLDLRELEAFASYFTEDGIWIRRGRNSEGRAAIIEDTDKIRTDTLVIRHVLTNFNVTIHDADHVDCITYMSGYRTDPGPDFDGPFVPFTSRAVWEYHDQLRRTSEGWRVSQRIAKPVFQEGE